MTDRGEPPADGLAGATGQAAATVPGQETSPLGGGAPAVNKAQSAADPATVLADELTPIRALGIDETRRGQANW